MFKYSHDLAQKTNRWRRRTLSPGQIPLPPLAVINELFEVAYHASYLTEEKRGVSFRLMCCNEDEYSQLRWSGFIGKVDVKNPIKFDAIRNFTTKEIMRLAPATKYNQTLICVGYEPLSSVENNYKLFIWGLLNVGSNWWDFIHGRTLITNHVPSAILTVSSIKSCFLSISYGHMDVIILQDGKIIRPHSVFLNGPIYEYFINAINSVYSMLKKYSIDTIEGITRTPEAFYFSILNRILHNINSIGHGASILIVAHKLGQDITRASDMKIKFPFNYNLVYPLIIQAMDCEIRYKKLYQKITISGGKKTEKDIKEIDSLNKILEETTSALSNSVNFIGSLTGVDGAIIMTDRFEVLGFGVEIMIKNKRLKKITFAENIEGTKGEKVSIDSFGTRHRSVFRFCNKYKDSVSFIISQDGGVKAIKHCSNKLICWPDIDLPVFQGT